MSGSCALIDSVIQYLIPLDPKFKFYQTPLRVAKSHLIEDRIVFFHFANHFCPIGANSSSFAAKCGPSPRGASACLPWPYYDTIHDAEWKAPDAHGSLIGKDTKDFSNIEVVNLMRLRGSGRVRSASY